MHAVVLEGRSLRNVVSRVGVAAVVAQIRFKRGLKQLESKLLPKQLQLSVTLHLFVECADSRVESC